jgi:hypothetical protein
MFSSSEALKELAFEQYIDGLAQAIGEQIDTELQTMAERLPSAKKRGSVATYSLTTLFLADSFYRKTGVGKFSGRLVVIWNGMDSFVFSPDPSQPFNYTTSEGRIIEPKLMHTDGGSVPRILRGLKKFSSWGYAPAFIVHDWLFTAKKCQYGPDRDFTFLESAQIMAEAIKTLMEVGFTDFNGNNIKLEKAEDTMYLMYLAISSFIAEDVWEDESTVICMR